MVGKWLMKPIIEVHLYEVKTVISYSKTYMVAWFQTLIINIA